MRKRNRKTKGILAVIATWTLIALGVAFPVLAAGALCIATVGVVSYMVYDIASS